MKRKKNPLNYRRDWNGVNPVTRIKQSKKKYNRKKLKRSLEDSSF